MRCSTCLKVPQHNPQHCTRQLFAGIAKPHHDPQASTTVRDHKAFAVGTAARPATPASGTPLANATQQHPHHHHHHSSLRSRCRGVAGACMQPPASPPTNDCLRCLPACCCATTPPCSSRAFMVLGVSMHPSTRGRYLPSSLQRPEPWVITTLLPLVCVYNLSCRGSDASPHGVCVLEVVDTSINMCTQYVLYSTVVFFPSSVVFQVCMF